MTEEDRKRLKEIRQRAHDRTNSRTYASDIDFLLSLLDRQPGDITVSAVIGYEAGYKGGVDACVEKVREYLTDCRDEETGIIEAIASELKSLTLDQVKQEPQP